MLVATQFSGVSELLVAYRSLAVRLAVAAAAFLVVAVAGSRAVTPVIDGLLRAREANETVRRSVCRAVRVAVFFVALAVGLTLGRFGYLLSASAMLVSALTLAVGFASQDVLGNLVSGVFMVWDPKVNVGDTIAWDDKTGVIEDISFRVTRVRTPDNELLSVPNSQLTNAALTNYSAKDARRLALTFPVAHDTDVAAVREALREEARAVDGVLDDPEPSTAVVDVNESRVAVDAYLWTGAPGRPTPGDPRSEFLQSAVERFKAGELDLADPYRELGGDLRLHDAEVAGDADDAPDDGDRESEHRSDSAAGGASPSAN